MNAIEVNDLDKSFGDTIALAGLSFRVTEGEIFALVGPDGAGKSTTMRMLAGIMKPTAGSATVLGFDTVREAEAVKEQIGYMSQRFGLYPDLSVEENIHFYADIYGVPRRGREDKIDRLLAFSNMKPFKKRLAGNLSGGMKQKLGLACALIHTPRVLLLDEPTNGVDPVSRRDFWRILYQLLKEGVTILVSTAYLDEAERATRVGLLHQGSLLAVDTPEGLKGLIDGVLLEVRAERPRAAAAALRAALPGSAVTLFGERVHVVTRRPRADTEDDQSGVGPRRSGYHQHPAGRALPGGRLRLGAGPCELGERPCPRKLTTSRSPLTTWSGVSATSSPSTGSASMSDAARSSAFSAPTAPASRPRSACSPGSSHRLRAPARWRGSTSSPSPRRSRPTSAT